MLEVDLAIVGAGPTGLFAAYYAGFRGLSTAVIDALPEPGGQVTAMYPEKMIYDVAGFPAIKGRDLVANLVEQAAPFEPHYLLGVRAEKLTYRGRAGRAQPLRRHATCTAARSSSPAGWAASPPARCRPPTRFAGDGHRLLRARTSTTWPGTTWSSSAAATRRSTGRWRCSRWRESVTLVHRRDKFRAHAVDGRPGAGAAGRDHRQRRGHPDASATSRVSGVEVDRQGRRARAAAGRHGGRRARLHRRPRPARRLGPATGQAPHPGRLHDGHEPAARLRGRRHHASTRARSG